MTPREAHRVLIAGAGVAGLEAMLALHAQAPALVRTTLLAPNTEFVYRPLATGEAFDRTKVTTFSLERLASDHGAAYDQDGIISVSPRERVVATASGRRLEYDTLLVGLGATREPAWETALTFTDERSVPAFRNLLSRLRSGQTRSVVFVVPRGVVWPFPLYELALMTAELVRREHLEVRLALVTPASTPLAMFGRDVAEAIAHMLAEREIEVHAGNSPRITGPGRVWLDPGDSVVTGDEVVALPRLTGPRIVGLPSTAAGFLAVDARARVRGVEDVYAVGDCANYPIKQGGLAAQQADLAIADVIARLLGRPRPVPAPPVLRGLLLTGEGGRFLRVGDEGAPGGTISRNTLWWPPTKIAGRFLAPALGFSEERTRVEEAAQQALVKVEIPVRPEGVMRDLERELV